MQSMFHYNELTKTDRRDALRLGVGLAAATIAAPALAAPTVAAGPGTRLLDPANPRDASQIYRKLRYRTDDGVVFSWIKGPYMAAVDGDLIPIYAINLGSIQRVIQNPDGGFDLIDLEISFRVDIDSGERLKDFRNPITGQTVRMAGRGPIPTRLRVKSDNEFVIPELPGQPRYEHVHAPVTMPMLGQGIFAIRDRSHARVTAPDGSVSYLNEVSTLSGPRDEVLDSRTTSVNAQVQSNDVRSWPAWMNMGDRPGTLGLIGNGGKVSRFADLPADWHAMLERYYPEIAADPIGVLDGKVKVKSL